MTIIGCWEYIVVEICHWCASSRLFIPRGCNVLASRAFLTESRVLPGADPGFQKGGGGGGGGWQTIFIEGW